MSKFFKSEYFISFFAAVVVITLAFAIAHVYPFGTYTAACSDMRMQFLNLTAALFDRIKNGQNIFVTYSGGLGTNLYAFAAYLLFSPFNILFLFFDKTNYQEVYLVITILKFGMTACCASVYLKQSKLTALSGAMNILLALMYAFCEYNLHTVINTMWMENTALLPIVLLGIEKAADRQKIKLLFISYFFCVLTNYYLSFITGLFAACWFVFYTASRAERPDMKQWLKSLFLCAAAAICAIGVCSFIILPAFANISSGYSDTFIPDFAEFVFKYDPRDIALFFTGFTQTLSISGLNGYMGIAPVFIAALYFADKEADKKERIAFAALLCFMLISFIIRPLYLMWHIFREPTGFYGRFIYTVAFLLTVIAAKFFKSGRKPQKKAVLAAFVTIIFIIALATFKGISDGLFFNIIWDILIAAVYAFAFSKQKKRLTAVLLGTEIFILSSVGMLMFRSHNNWYRRNDFPDHLNAANEVIANINDDGFYRMTDVTNDDIVAALGIGYNALETFSSQTNQKSLSVMSQLGIWCPYDYRIVNNYYNSIVTESLFNIKYVMATNKACKVKDDLGREFYAKGGLTTSQRLASDNYKLVFENENSALYENTHVFPLMFAVNEEALTSNTRFYDKVENISGAYKNQATFLNDMFGTDYKLYDEEMLKDDKPLNASVQKDGGSIRIGVIPNEGGGYEGFDFKVEKGGEYLIDQRIYNNSDKPFLYAANTYAIDFDKNIETDTVFNTDIGPYKKGDNINLILQASAPLDMNYPLLLRLRSEEFDDLSKRANDAALNDIRLSDDNIITAVSDYDEEKLIFSSLSYDEGFHVYIDGSEAEKIRIADAFLGFDVPSGRHDIEIRYVSPWFYKSLAVSAVFAVLSAVLLVFDKKRRVI